MKKVLVTPDIAKEWLANQATNRTKSRVRTSYYGRIMQGEKWICHPALSLRFNERGQLADGQHRLTSIVDSNISCWFYIETLADDVLDAIHDIKHRSLSDRLVMGNGWNGGDAKILASIGSAVAWRMENSEIDVLDRI